MDTQTSSNKGFLMGIIALTLIVGGVAGSVLLANANAQTVTTVPQAQETAESQEPKAIHVSENGQREELLVGDIAERVRAEALKAVPGGEILRVETEVDGNGIYEAHMTKSDGTSVTVYFDSNYNVTSTEEGSGKMKAR